MIFITVIICSYAFQNVMGWYTYTFYSVMRIHPSCAESSLSIKFSMVQLKMSVPKH